MAEGILVTQEQRIGIVAAVMDAYPRHAPTGTPVLVRTVSVPEQ